jgi:hypothetical protein
LIPDRREALVPPLALEVLLQAPAVLLQAPAVSLQALEPLALQAAFQAREA